MTLSLILKDRRGAMDNVEQEIKGLIAEVLETPFDKITPDARFVEDLGMDSMMALEILAAIEKKYRITIPEENLTKISSLKEVSELVKKYKPKEIR